MVDSVLEVQNIKTTGISPQKDIVTTDSGTGDVTVKGNVVIPDNGTIGSASDTDAITIDSSGNVTLAEKLIIDPTKGIQFRTSTGGSGTFGSGILDDYEEGTWTPTNNGDATGAVNGVSGVYVKIGNQVTVHGIFTIAVNFTSTEIGGLPFAPTNAVSAASTVHGNVLPRSDGNIRYFQLNEDSYSLVLKSDHDNSFVPPATTDGTFRFVATYLTGF